MPQNLQVHAHIQRNIDPSIDPNGDDAYTGCIVTSQPQQIVVHGPNIAAVRRGLRYAVEAAAKARTVNTEPPPREWSEPLDVFVSEKDAGNIRLTI